MQSIQLLFQNIIPLIGNWIYVVLFFCVVLESNPLTGFISPGIAMIILSTIFARLGFTSIYYIVIISFIGMVIGDLIGYLIAIRYFKLFMQRKSAYAKIITKLINFHLGKSLIIGKFNPITRSFVPFFAGKNKISLSRFFFYSSIGSIVYVIVFVLLGWTFWTGMNMLTRYIFWIAIIIISYFLWIIRTLLKKDLYNTSSE